MQSFGNILSKESNSRGEDLLDCLRSRIIQGQYKDGEKLAEQQICDEFGMSRTPVREALKQLEAEGLVRCYLNRGSYVQGFSQQDLADLYEMRKAFEILAVRWAAERAEEEELLLMEEAFDFMEFYTRKQDPEKMLNINRQFHAIIYKASHNKRLENTLLTYQRFVSQSKADGVYLNGQLDEVLEEHRRIFKACCGKDPDAAAAAMEAHLGHAADRALTEE